MVYTKSPLGRPPKYAPIIHRLEDDQLYSPASICRFADAKGFIHEQDPQHRKKVRMRIRIAMARLANNRGFPDNGDGLVKLDGLPPIPGWFGWRWKTVYTH